MGENSYSIVATTYNDEKEITRYLYNIVQQIYAPEEIIIADGGSTDNTVNIILEYAKTSVIPIKVISGNRLNIAQGYNAAIKAAKTELIGITGIGNTYDSNYFLLLNKELKTHDYELTYSPIRGEKINSFTELYINTFLNGDKGKRMSIASNHGALSYKRVFEQLGYFYENFIYAGEDAEFYQRAKQYGLKTACVPDAKVYWMVPTDYKQFKKQISNYTLGDIQILTNSSLFKIIVKKIISFLIGIIIIIVSLLANMYLFIAELTTCVIIVCVYKILYPQKSLYLLATQKIYPLIVYLKKRKYFDKKYKVNRL